MTTIQYGIQNYRNHNPLGKTSPSTHPLDILSSILFDIKTDNRRREADFRKDSETSKNSRESFDEILKREIEK